MAGKNPFRSSSNVKFHDIPNQSAGVRDDHAVRKNVATREGTIEKVPINNSDIANKKYVDDSFPVTHASTTGQTANDHHAQIHSVASHSDTSATGAELNTLTDNSVANNLHRHSELVASDGAPDPALSVDADGNVGIGTTSPTASLQVGDSTIGEGANLFGAASVGGLLVASEVEDSIVMIEGTDKASIVLSDISSAENDKLMLIRNAAGLTRFSSVHDAFDSYVKENILVLDHGTGRVGIGTTSPKSKLHVTGLPIYANNAAAVTGGLTTGAFYRTGADPDPVMVVH